jgi:hypothetical protein
MKPRIALACMGLLLAGLAWFGFEAPSHREPAAPAQARPPGPAARLARTPSASPVLALDRRAAIAPGTVAAKPPSLEMEFLRSRSYHALYERIRSGAEAETPAGKYVMFEILRACATVADRNRRYAGKTMEERRNAFYAALPAGDPQRDKRAQAFEAVAVDRCAGLSAVSVTQGQLDQLLTDAANGGEPGARASLIEQQLAQGRRGRWNSASPTDEQVESLKQVIASRDPEALLIAGRLLSNPYDDLSLRVGPGAQPAEPRAMYNAWQVLACDFGYPCGADNTRVQSACAYQGHCDAASLPDYLSYYGSSPHDAQLVDQYHAILGNAIRTGDWSQLAVVRGPRFPAEGGFAFNPLGPR